jgi:hypothetical protein
MCAEAAHAPGRLPFSEEDDGGPRLPGRVLGSIMWLGVRGMKESTTYQAILAEEARKLVLRQGTKRFGPPLESWRTTLEEITDLERLENLSERLLDVESWEELLAG